MFADLTMDKVRGCLLFFTLQQRITETSQGLQRAIVGGRQIALGIKIFKVVGWYKVISDLAGDKILLLMKLLKYRLRRFFIPTL